MESPHCLTPCDGSEAGFAGIPIPGELDPCKLDCAFDGSHGSGDDGCAIELLCSLARPADENCSVDMPCPPSQPPECFVNCLPLTPNGCDCFGCCELAPASGEFRLTGQTGYPGCSVSDPSSCPLCNPAPDCFNPCDACELCVGRPDLPPDCGQQACPLGREPCGLPCQASCPEGRTCQTGCCTPFW